MNDTDRRLVLRAQANADEWDLYGPTGNSVTMDAARDRRELLRIVREQDARIDVLEGEAEYAVGALNDPEVLGAIAKGRLKAVLGWDTQAEDHADDAAAERATSGKWGG